MSYLDERFSIFIGRKVIVSEDELEELCEEWGGEEDENGIISGEGCVVFDSHPYNEDDDDEEMDEEEDDWDESDEWEVSANLRFEIENGMLTMVEPEVSIYGDPGLGEEDPEDTWNEDDEVSALEFLRLITCGDENGMDKSPENQDDGMTAPRDQNRKKELATLLTACLNEATIGRFIEQLAEACVYTSSGSLRSKGKNDVADSLTRIQDVCAKEGIKTIAWQGNIVSTDSDEYHEGDPCVILAQHDEWNCAGFFTIDLDENGLVSKLIFDTDSGTRFQAVESDGVPCKLTHFPENAFDAIQIRAESIGLARNGFLDPGVHFRISNVPHKIAKMIFKAVVANNDHDFKRIMRNAAGYAFSMGMCYQYQERTGEKLFETRLDLTSDEPVAVLKHQDWISDGHNTGKELLFAFFEYVDIKGVHNLDIEKQLEKAYTAIAFAGAISADKDIDNGFLNLLMEDEVVPKLIDLGSKCGFVEKGDSLPCIYDILELSSYTSISMLQRITKLGEEKGYSKRLIMENTLVFCAYAGIGAVLLWRENGNKLPDSNYLDMLEEPRGLFYMDEHIHDLMGMPYESDEAKTLVQHLFDLRTILMEGIEEYDYDPLQTNEFLKAMFDYGMIYAICHFRDT